MIANYPVITKTEVGTRLRMFRLNAGLTQQAVEKITDGEITHPMISRYENGVSALSLDRLQKLADIYKVPTYLILFNIV